MPQLKKQKSVEIHVAIKASMIWFSRGKHKKIHAQVVLDAQFHSLYRESQGSSENVVPEKMMNTPKQ